MEVRKICRFLIVIFIALSLLFFFLYDAEQKMRTVVSDDFVADAVKNLSSRGISVDASDIDTNVPERDIYYFEINDENEYYEEVTSSIRKSLFGNEVITTEFDTPDGYSVGIYDKTSNEKELGRILFSQADLSFVFSKIGLSMTDGDKPIENMQTDEIDDSAMKVIRNLITDLSEGSKLGYTITGSSSNDTFLIVTVMQTVDESIVSDAYINFVFRDGELVIVSGNWITETPKAKYHNTLLDGVNVLYKLNLDEVAEIESESVVYSLRKTDGNKYFILPCWKISYFDKQGNLVTSYFDALK